MGRDLWGTHVAYEIERCATPLPYMLTEEVPIVVEHSCFEASLLHTRNVIEFLVGRNGNRPWRRDDISATEFLPNWELTAQRVRLREHYTVINKHLVHLARQRGHVIDEPHTLGKHAELVASVLEVVGEYAASLPDDAVARELSAAHARADAALRQFDTKLSSGKRLDTGTN